MAFDCFVILAGMRTGSNFLEANLNEYPGLHCHGELFNPHFIGHAGKTSLFGMTIEEREADPLALVRLVRRKTEGLAGFRLFDDHDPRVLQAVLADPAVAKVVLSRNPLESYVSLKIAGETGQWRLGDMRHAKSARIAFDRAEFAEHLARTRSHQDGVLRQLQVTGQTGFFLTYEDVGEIEVMNGLARFLGVTEERKATSAKTKKQNPDDLEAKVTNYAEMVASLSGVDPFDLGRTPVFEPRRGPIVPQFLAAARAPLLFMPLKGGPTASVSDWLGRLDGVDVARLPGNFSQKTLRQWMREREGHRSFAVLRHPVRRLHEAFCRHILATGAEPFHEIRETLRKTYKLPLPDRAGHDVAAHRAAFLAFAKFIAGNLAGQTSVRIDSAWATQAAILQGMAQFALPDRLLREDELARDLPHLAAEIGRDAPEWIPAQDEGPHPLDAIHDAEIESAVRNACQRDYTLFGFRDWAPGA